MGRRIVTMADGQQAWAEDAPGLVIRAAGQLESFDVPDEVTDSDWQDAKAKIKTHTISLDKSAKALTLKSKTKEKV